MLAFRSTSILFGRKATPFLNRIRSKLNEKPSEIKKIISSSTNQSQNKEEEMDDKSSFLNNSSFQEALKNARDALNEFEINAKLSPLNQSLYDEPDAPKHRPTKGPPRPEKVVSRNPNNKDKYKKTKIKKKGEEENNDNNPLSSNDVLFFEKKLGLTFPSWNGRVDFDPKELEKVRNEINGRFLNQFAPAFSISEGIDEALDDYHDDEVERGEAVSDLEYMEDTLRHEMFSLEKMHPEELERVLRQKDGTMRGMFSLDDLNDTDEQKLLHSLGIWGNVDPVPEKLLKIHSENLEDLTYADEDDNYNDEELGDSDEDEEIQEMKINKFLKKQGIFEDSKGDFVAGNDSEDDLDRQFEKKKNNNDPILEKNASPSNGGEVKNDLSWSEYFIPEDETDFKYGDNDDTVVVEDEIESSAPSYTENIEDGSDDNIPSDFVESNSDNENLKYDEDEEVARYASNPFSHLDEPEEVPIESKDSKESRYVNKMKKKAQKEKLIGLEELDPYHVKPVSSGANKLTRLLEEAKRKKLATEHGKMLKNTRPRDGVPMHKRQLTLAALFEGHLDDVISNGIVKFKNNKSIYETVEIVDVTMSGDLQIINVSWRLNENGSKYQPQEFNYSDKPEIRRMQLHKDRPERRENARKYLEAIKNKKEKEVQQELENLSKKIRFELGRRVTLKRVPHLLFKLDIEGKKNEFLKEIIDKEVNRGNFDKDIKKSTFYNC